MISRDVWTPRSTVSLLPLSLWPFSPRPFSLHPFSFRPATFFSGRERRVAAVARRSALAIVCVLPAFAPRQAFGEPVEGAHSVKYFSGQQSLSSPSAAGASREVAPPSDVAEERNSYRATRAAEPDALEPRYRSSAQRAFHLNEEGVQLVFQGERQRGRKKLEDARSLQPKNSTVLYNIAGLDLAEGHAADAVKNMELAASLEPHDLSFMNRLAQAYFANKDLRKSAETYQRLVDQDPAQGEALLRLGTIYGMLRQWGKAEESLAKAAEVQPEDAPTLVNYGNVLVLQRKYRDAIRVLNDAQRIHETPQVAVALGMAHEAIFEHHRALELYRKAKELGDEDANLDRHIASLESRVGKRDGEERVAAETSHQLDLNDIGSFGKGVLAHSAKRDDAAAPAAPAEAQRPEADRPEPKGEGE